MGTEFYTFSYHMYQFQENCYWTQNKCFEMFCKFVYETSYFKNKWVLYYSKFTYVYMFHSSYLYQILVIIILWTYFDKNIKRVMNNSPVAEG